MNFNHTKLKEIPVTERPYEKFLTFGPAALSDAELIAVIIKTGSRDKNSIDLAREILKGNDGTYSLMNLYDKSFKELTAVDGIGKVKAITLKCAAELSVRLNGVKRRERLVLTDPSTVSSYYMESMRHLKTEETRVVFADGANRMICDEVMTLGTVNKAYISPREIFIKALEYGAVSIILLHNHPSGDPTPSKEDILITGKIKEAGKLIDITLLDHIIIGDGRYISILNDITEVRHWQ
ncbi:MAG: DNA repair protein RadC [Lachnospiraceae bacterium]|nr:DNA repair protein RadC [Lachnospiraceae bacterium]